LRTALNACAMKLTSVAGVTKETSIASLSRLLKDSLERAHDFVGSPDSLVKKAIELGGSLSKESGFPGFHDEPNSKPHFEQTLQRLSC
jgi:hypothetical protein